jgi:hypothetical protein
VAVACLIVGLWAPMARADELGAPESAPPSDATPASDTTSTAETTPPVAETQVVSPPAASDGSGSGGPEQGGGSSEPPPGGQAEAPPPDQRPQDSAAEGETRLGDSAPRGAGSATSVERSAETNAQRAPASPAGDVVAPAAPAAALPIAGSVAGSPPASGAEGISDLLPVALGGGGIGPGLAAIDTGGMSLLLASSLACRVIVCYGQSVGSLGSTTLATRLRGHGGAGRTASEASEVPVLLVPGPGGPHDGAFFSLSGGGGGTGVGFTLLTLVALLAAWLVRQRDWTTALRILPAVFPPSAYVPPIESPG